MQLIQHVSWVSYIFLDVMENVSEFEMQFVAEIMLENVGCTSQA
jgi:hypothetical protein